ncbi:hypothetical protein FCL47_16600 [Desulfopila sp. IMCC35006]|uniref:hypothetical protein n=1 Tax=Desulfopila sp. IMCC35006 TaxID=2569542 RepID=UPI0010AB90EB|nr:hypothetical protein [Desulfopila sp. IMCC35006]TKB24859.1 hypothetical protein FCL47_16600 [Desulfopila sp. IMCC35006]
MTDEKAAVQEIESFLQSWQGDKQPMREWFRQFYQQVSQMEGVGLTFVARPGVSYSIRPVHVNQAVRDKFAIVDVIDDDPNERWLSVCFYEDMITDPDGRGEIIPGGLSGSDGYCFDMYNNDEELGHYLLARLQEAATAAAAG